MQHLRGNGVGDAPKPIIEMRMMTLVEPLQTSSQQRVRWLRSEKPPDIQRGRQIVNNGCPTEQRRTLQRHTRRSGQGILFVLSWLQMKRAGEGRGDGEDEALIGALRSQTCTVGLH